jgi:hypothetical protein
VLAHQLNRYVPNPKRTMTMEPVLHSFAYRLDFLREQVADVPPDDMVAQPDGIMNHGFASKKRIVPLIHTGLQPGDERHEKMRETVLTVCPLDRFTEWLSPKKLSNQPAEKPLKRLLNVYGAGSPG